MKALSRLLRFATILFLLAVALTIAGLHNWRTMQEDYRGFEGDAVFVEVERGMSTEEIAALLADRGVIAHRWHFRLLRYLRPGAVLQAGEYRFSKAASVLDVFDRIRRGDIYFVTISVPEGANIFEIASILGRSDLRQTADFLQHAKDPTLIKDIAPEAPSLEGYLFPSTYQFLRRTTSAEICKRLTDEFRSRWKSLGSPKDVHRLVTIASLVEKETSIDSERDDVSSVYWNRITEGMRLDCDPTVIYAALLEGRYRGTIYLSDLQRDHPYNTYRRSGLPPGPIANPGTAALRAAIHPAQTKYLFFVAKGDGSGGHRFSESLSAHTKAVTLYRNAVKSNGQTRDKANAASGGNP